MAATDWRNWGHVPFLSVLTGLSVVIYLALLVASGTGLSAPVRIVGGVCAAALLVVDFVFVIGWARTRLREQRD